jgi:DNA-directed RNA polymerase specialized sigma subunit
MSEPIRVHERGEQELHDLWDRFKSTADGDAREGLILHYSALVKFVAGRLRAGLPRNVDAQDLISYGTSERDSGTVGDLMADHTASDPSGSFEKMELRYMLADSVNRLPDRERLVVTLYYFEGLTLAEIGKVLSVTESRVCQIHTKAVMSLRNRLMEPPFKK